MVGIKDTLTLFERCPDQLPALVIIFCLSKCFLLQYLASHILLLCVFLNSSLAKRNSWLRFSDGKWYSCGLDTFELGFVILLAEKC